MIFKPIAWPPSSEHILKEILCLTGNKVLIFTFYVLDFFPIIFSVISFFLSNICGKILKMKLDLLQANLSSFFFNVLSKLLIFFLCHLFRQMFFMASLLVLNSSPNTSLASHRINLLELKNLSKKFVNFFFFILTNFKKLFRQYFDKFF